MKNYYIYEQKKNSRKSHYGYTFLEFFCVLYCQRQDYSTIEKKMFTSCIKKFAGVYL